MQQRLHKTKCTISEAPKANSVLLTLLQQIKNTAEIASNALISRFETKIAKEHLHLLFFNQNLKTIWRNFPV